MNTPQYSMEFFTSQHNISLGIVAGRWDVYKSLYLRLMIDFEDTLHFRPQMSIASMINVVKRESLFDARNFLLVGSLLYWLNDWLIV